MTGEPCPFCGEALKEVYDGLQHSYRTRSEPGEEPPCYMNGVFLGKERAEAWNRRVPVRMEIEDGLPVFGRSGKPSSFDLINQTIRYLAGRST